MASTPSPRKMTRGRKPAKKAPTGRMLRESQGSVTLEEVLVNLQRGLARATRSSLETARADWQVGMGQRALYVIDGINVTLHAGLVMARDAQGHVQAVSLDLGNGTDAGLPGQATLEFRIASRPIEPISDEQLVLADLDPLGLQRPRHLMRVTLIGHLARGEPAVKPLREVPVRGLRGMAKLESVADEEPPGPLSPLPGRKLHLYVVGSATGSTEAFELTTNAIGQVDVEIDALANRIVSGELSAGFEQLDLARKDSEFFVWAACKPELAQGIVNNLTSNVLQYTVKREAAGAAHERSP